MNEYLEFKILTKDNLSEIAPLVKLLNPELTIEAINDYLAQMFGYENYIGFGVYHQHKLVGIASGWIFVKFYCGKQLEVENVVVRTELQSKGIGKLFFAFIENWAKQHQCNTVELNTYVQNSKSHKFYFNQGYSILGFHFRKYI